jgi:hypothetical protein
LASAQLLVAHRLQFQNQLILACHQFIRQTQLVSEASRFLSGLPILAKTEILIQNARVAILAFFSDRISFTVRKWSSSFVVAG